jgi:hypothetical protein
MREKGDFNKKSKKQQPLMRCFFEMVEPPLTLCGWQLAGLFRNRYLPDRHRFS